MSVDNMVGLAKGGPWDFYDMIPANVDVRDVALAHIRAVENPAAEVRPRILLETLHHRQEQMIYIKQQTPLLPCSLILIWF